MATRPADGLRPAYQDDHLEQELAEERTQRVPRVLDRDEETILDVDGAPAYSPVVYTTASTRHLAVRKGQQVVWYIFGVLETLLALRFLLFAVGANWSNPFFMFIAGVTSPFVAPFASLVETPRIGQSTLETGTIFAMIIYLLVAVGLSRLVELLLSRGDV